MTQQRFGKTIRLFAPLYLSNECINNCSYCGFSRDNPILRVTLSLDEVRQRGARRSRSRASATFCSSRANIRNLFPTIICAIASPRCTPTGRASRSKSGRWKRRNIVRSSRRARTGWSCIRKLTTARSMRRCTPPGRNGISTGGWKRRSAPTPPVFAGWASARFTVWPTGVTRRLSAAAHADYLLRNCWKAALTISTVRIRPCAGEFEPLTHISDRELAQLICALRLMFPDVGIVLSTREKPKLRDGLIPLGVTMMSAGARTEPGGYTGAGREKIHHTERGIIKELASGASEWAPQAEPRRRMRPASSTSADERPPGEVAERIRKLGYEPVWKDWDAALTM